MSTTSFSSAQADRSAGLASGHRPRRDASSTKGSAHWLGKHRARLLAALALAAIAVGGALHLAGESSAGDQVWKLTTVALALELSLEVTRTVVVDRQMGVDTIALVAMVGALALGEELAGIVVGLMFSGGAALEELASGRASRELTQLLVRAPKVCQIRVGDSVEQVEIDQVQVGDTVVVRTGELIPVDGTLVTPSAVIDTSTVSGESLPLTVSRGMAVLSGTANAGGPLEVTASRPASESAYAALVSLVEQAQAHRAPFMRMADRYAGFFLVVTLLVSAGAWALSGDPVRGLAVVVVATPCPLILAAPIAFVSGLSRAARSGVIVKGVAAIEVLGRARTALFDKTGTLTTGTPAIQEIRPVAGADQRWLLSLAASVDQLSAHVLAGALVRAAREAGIRTAAAVDAREEPGQGIEATVGGRRVAVGSAAFMKQVGVIGQELTADRMPSLTDGEAHVLVAVDGHLNGTIVMADELRPEVGDTVGRLRREGIRHVAMVSGDRRAVAERVGRQAGVDRVYSELSPEAKLDVVRRMRDSEDLRPVLMVGDGINDAPGLALADVGIAMGAAGATVASETADAVIVVDRLDRVCDAVHAGHRSVTIARQSVIAGMGLSICAMGVAAAGYLPPVAGALLQEGIDLAVILNALRALRG